MVDFRGLLGQQSALRSTLETGALSEVAQFRVNRSAIDTSSLDPPQPPAPDELTKESWHLGPGEPVDVKIEFTGASQHRTWPSRNPA